MPRWHVTSNRINVADVQKGAIHKQLTTFANVVPPPESAGDAFPIASALWIFESWQCMRIMSSSLSGYMGHFLLWGRMCRFMRNLVRISLIQKRRTINWLRTRDDDLPHSVRRQVRHLPWCRSRNRLRDQLRNPARNNYGIGHEVWRRDKC